MRAGGAAPPARLNKEGGREVRHFPAAFFHPLPPGPYGFGPAAFLAKSPDLMMTSLEGSM